MSFFLLFVVNCTAQEASSVYHSVNVITGEYCEAQNDLYLGGGNSIPLRRQFEKNRWVYNHPNIFANNTEGLSEIQLSNLHLTYSYDDDSRLAMLQCRQNAGEKVVGWWHFSYPDIDVCQIDSSDNKRLIYRCNAEGLLEEVISYIGKNCKYSYRKHPKDRDCYLIASREIGNGSLLEIEYIDDLKDPFVGRVKSQKASLGTNGELVTTHQFKYFDTHTEVLDALGHKTIYRHNTKYLTAVEQYTDTNQLLRTEHFYYTDERLCGRSISDHAGQVWMSTVYRYDAKGNLIKETLYGNLSGQGVPSFSVDNLGIPLDKGVEQYSKESLFSEVEPVRLIKQVEDNGTTTHYRYEGSSTKPCAKLTEFEGKIHIRNFFFYDSHGSLVQTIIDDGSSIDFECLSGVTERHFTKYQLCNAIQGFGLPEVVEEGYLDLNTNQEVVLKSVRNKYDSRGNVIEQVSLGQNGDVISIKTDSHDVLGRVLSSEDSFGRSTKNSYDQNGKLLTSQHSFKNKIVQKTNTYDRASRLISSVEKPFEGFLKTTSYRYDAMGNVLAQIDTYGNETVFEYDSLSRVIETIYPSVLDESEQIVHLVEKKEYDIFNRVIAETDANGDVKKTRFNVRGKPIEILYPNGTQESFEYNLDGSVHKAVARNKTAVFYKQDFLARAIQTDVYDSSGKLFASSYATYNAFHLLQTVNVSGETKDYEYDFAGRLKTENGPQECEYSYDSQGRQIEKKVWFGKGGSEYINSINKYNSQSEITETELCDASGNVLKQFLKNDEKAFRNIQYGYVYNDRGQQVQQVIITDEKGCIVTIQMDAMNRVENSVKTDPFGKILKKEACRYDKVGNKILEVHDVIRPDGTTSQFEISWQFGTEKRLESVTEGVASHEQMKTTYLYNTSGFLQHLVKPDGVSLSYEYDEMGRAVRFCASDNSFDYHYVYDAENRILQVEDSVSGSITKRNYEKGNITSETLGNGLQITNAFDLLGRKTRMILPDQSTVSYEYNAVYLKAIRRTTQNGSSYAHQYKKHDLNGNVLETSLIGNLGNAKFQQSSKGQCLAIVTPYWSQSIIEAAGNITEIHTQESSENINSTYAYDASSQVEMENGEFNYKYSYDSLSNRLNQNEDIASFDAHNRLVSDGKNTYNYNVNGCLIEKSKDGKIWQYEYDALNRLIGITHDDCQVKYQYDAFSRRLSKTVHDAQGSKTLRYILDGNHEIGAVDEAGRISELRVLGTGSGAEFGAAIAIELGEHVYAPIHDFRGNVCCLVDIDKKSAVEFYRYSAFGECLVYDKTGQKLETSEVGNPWRFASKRFDEESGYINFGKRLYDPTLGRWISPDPLGYVDGPNLYAYVHNNPILSKDFHGLFSWGGLWDSIVSAVSNMYETISGAVTYLQDHYSYYNYTKNDIDYVLENIFGTQFLAMTGYYLDYPDTGVYGEGEYNDKVRITCINGILNIRSDWMCSVAAISNSHGGINVHYVLYPTEGWTRDLLMAAMAKFGYVSTHTELLADTWKEMILEMGGTESGGTIIHYAHSIGGTNTLLARDLLTPEEQRMIRVITIGSATMVPSTGFQSVVNYMSYRDGVGLSDPIGFFRGLFSIDDNVVFLGSFLGIPLMDHMLTQETYRRAIEMFGKDFVELYLAS
jgi:RHS repeat-associated protein